MVVLQVLLGNRLWPAAFARSWLWLVVWACFLCIAVVFIFIRTPSPMLLKNVPAQNCFCDHPFAIVRLVRLCALGMFAVLCARVQLQRFALVQAYICRRRCLSSLRNTSDLLVHQAPLSVFCVRGVWLCTIISLAFACDKLRADGE